MVAVRSLKVTLCLLACLMIPAAALADTSIDFSNSGGTLTGSSSGFTLSGSTLVVITGFSGGGSIVAGNLGSVSFSTGALTSGSLDMGGTLAAGGSFTITGNGTNGVPSGTLFSGSFSGPVTWSLITLANGTHSYTLTGTLTGTAEGFSVNGITVQLTINTGKGFFSGSTMIVGGDTSIVGSVPEPSTVAMLGTGLIGMLGAVRRKIRC